MFVSINGHTIRSNAKHGKDDPPIRIAKTPFDKKPVYAHEIEFGPGKLVYNGERIMGCGARLVLQADEVRIVR